MARKRKYTKRKNTKKASKESLSIIVLIILGILLGFLIYTKSGTVGVTLNEILGGMMGVSRLLLPISFARGIASNAPNAPPPFPCDPV